MKSVIISKGVQDMGRGMTWQLIETAPMDGTWIAVRCEGSTPDVASWRNGRWVNIANHLDWVKYHYDLWPLYQWMPLEPLKMTAHPVFIAATGPQAVFGGDGVADQRKHDVALGKGAAQ